MSGISNFVTCLYTSSRMPENNCVVCAKLWCDYIPVRIMTQHLTKECGMMEETCTLGCGVMMPRNELRKHARNTCVKRIVSCKHCQRYLKSCDMLKHRDSCPKIKLACGLGCGVVVCREDTSHHLKNCSLVEEMCTLGCGMKLTRNELKIHMDNCSHRIVECEHCIIDFKLCDMPKHLNECPKMKLSCERKCGVVTFRENMTQHLEEFCSEKEIACPFAKYKCEVTSIKRKYLSQHLEDETKHLGLKLNTTVFNLTETKQKLNTTVFNLTETKQKLNTTEQKLTAIENTLSKQGRVSKEIKQHINESKKQGVRTEKEVNQQRKYTDNQVLVRINRMCGHITALCSIGKITMLDWEIENLSKFIQINHSPKPCDVVGQKLNIYFLKEYIQVGYGYTHENRGGSIPLNFLTRLYSTIKGEVVKEYDFNQTCIYSVAVILPIEHNAVICAHSNSD